MENKKIVQKNILETINSPADVKALSLEELKQLAEEIRQFLISVISKTGGHLAPNLGVVELTLALHRVFSTPEDKLIFDVGHQSYIHKIITGRREQFPTLRQYGGLSGFPKRTESAHDAFGTGHSSTSISAVNKTVTSGEPFSLYMIAENHGADGSTTVEVMEGDQVLTSKYISVEGGSFIVVTMDVVLEGSGEHTLTVGDNTLVITVE